MPNTTAPLVVVAGANGRLGRLIVASLLTQPGVRVRALVRRPAEAADLRSDRVELHTFDLSTATDAELGAATAGAFAVVSTLQGGPDVIIDGQLKLMAAAKAAGARRFIPSDYSYNMFTLPPGVNINTDWRRAFAERASAARSADFEVVHVLQGIFIDRLVMGFLGVLDAERRVIRYWGDGQTLIDWTTWEDTAAFTAAAALDERPVPERLFVSGDRRSLLDFAEAWSAVYGPLTVERLGSLDELKAETARRLATSPQDMYAWLPLMYAQGVFGGEALLGPSEAGRYPELRPLTVAEAIARGVV
ncbi:NAD(P)H-binding protein [Myxococcota bacterium]|nr:NAD(P)H-binding protein [Myxococcota bacterium]